MRYRAWLLPDVGDDTTMPLLLGTFAGGSVELTYADERHRNLLATYSGMRITVEPEAKTPKVSPELPSQNPATWRWEGFIANLPTPGDPAHASFLSHVRHLLAREPTLQANQMPGGLALWLTRNVAKLAEWASAAQGNWQGAQTSEGEAAQIHRHLLRILEYVDGLFYYTRDVPAGSPWLVDRVAGKIGLLNSVPDQNPPALLTHVALHLTGLTSSPGHTEQQKQLVLLMEKVIEQMQTDMQQVRQDAVALVKKTPQQLQQPESRTTLNHLVLLTSRLTSGWLDTASGTNLGGVVWMSSRLQQLATISLLASKHA
ncbi:MAG: hypothetical protein IMW89_21510 [Ktedonobacteraceae bacterium]|nr:hypothetical protein [Ktedonobacteraceae bacterium]